MRKYILLFMIAIFLLFSLLFIFRSQVVENINKDIISLLESALDERGVELVDVEIARSNMGFFGLAWEDIKITLELEKGALGDVMDNRIYVYANAAKLTCMDIFKNLYSLDVRGITILYGEDLNTSENWLFIYSNASEGSDLKIRFKYDLINPPAARRYINEYADNIAHLIKYGRSLNPVEGSVLVTFIVNGTPVKVRIETAGITNNGDYQFVLNMDDLRELSGKMADPFSEMELQIVSRYPHRAAKLLSIWKEGVEASNKAYAVDRDFPRDAYKNMLISYLITRSYGDDFAELIGEAHEIADTGNSYSQRQMDLHNNLLGREYAKMGYTRAELRDKVKTDVLLVRNPSEIAGAGIVTDPRHAEK